MAGKGSADIRSDIAGRESYIEPSFQIEKGQSADLSRFGQETVADVARPQASEGSVSTFVDSALGESGLVGTVPTAQPRQQERAEQHRVQATTRPGERTQVSSKPRRAQAATAMANPITPKEEPGGERSTRAATMASAAPAPVAHPGASLVLNMERGMVENTLASQDEQLQTQATSEIGGLNELDGSNLVSRPPEVKFSSESDPKTNPVLNPPTQKVKDDAQQMKQRMAAREMMSRGREEIRREGVVERPVVQNTLTSANRTFGKIRSILKDTVDRTLKRKTYSGMSFYETIFSKPNLMPHCVSLGSDNLYESLREPNSNLLSLVNSQLPPDQQLSLEECLADIQLLVDAINSVNIEVTLDKSPVNINHSIQVRVLRAHMGRGIGLHPTQTKVFNADYDGDPAVVNMDQTQLVRYARAMDRLVSIDGKPLIDPDFFPLEPVDNKDEVLDILKNRNLSWNPRIASDVIDAYTDACNNGDWVGLLRKIDEIAEREAEIDGSRNEHAAAILMSLYDFSIDMRALSINSQLDNINGEHSNYSPPPPGTDPFILNLINLTDEIVAGRTPPSIVEFTRFFNKYYGDIKGKKNVPFRLLADFAKAINRTDLITVGSDLFGFKLTGKGDSAQLEADEDSTVSLHDLWQFTCVASLTKQISGRCHMGSRGLAVSTQVRAMVLREVPPREYTNDADFRAWIEDFRASYNFNMRMLNLAQVSFRGGMAIDRSESLKFDGIGKDLKGIDDALVRVYGQQTVGSLFPNLIRPGNSDKPNTSTTVARYYRNMTLSKFAVNNRLNFRSDTNTGEFAMEGIQRRIRSNEFTPMDILMLVADRRTKQFGRYNEEWMVTTANHFEAIASKGMYVGEDYLEYTANIMETISMMSPEMFLHFHMDSPTTFRNSKWGKRLLGSKTVEEYQSHLVSMMVEYRLGRSSEILDEIKDAEETQSVAALDALEDALQCEFDSLASSSMVWKTIVRESLNGNANFKKLVAENGNHADWKNMHARESFWTRPAEEKEKYYSLINFLKSSEPLDVKLAVLADVTRVAENYPDIHPNEILGQLAHHPDRLHAGNRFDMMDKGLSTDIDYIKESAEKLSSYRANTPDKIREEAFKFLEKHAQDEQAFMSYIERLATDPGYAVHVDTIFAADAIASVFDKTYADSEKIHQQASVNGYFGCISYQRSGGYYTHLHMTDNAVVNMVGFDQITPRDILLVLSDPKITLYAYDEFGAPVTLSRQSLCGGNSTSDVMRFLETNPRIVLMCKRCMAGIKNDVDGTARIKSIGDDKMFDTGTYRVFSMFNDRPRFLAAAALFTKSDWKTGREISENVNENIQKLCQFVAYAVQNKLSGMELVEEIERVTGLNIDKMAQLRRSGRFDEGYDNNDFDASMNLYTEVFEEILDCIGVLQRSDVALPQYPKPSKFGDIDESSIIAYYDVRQQISGARTETMIGVEGAETKKNLVLKTFLKGRPDSYTMSADGKTVIPLVPGLEQASDMSLINNESMQTNSVCKYLEIKRENGAETFNAKYKKYGDDGSNSMIKFIRMAKRSVFEKFGKPQDSDMLHGTWSIEDGADLLTKISSCSTKAEAVPVLAQALIDADIRLGYIDVNEEGQITDDAFVPSDYWNRADLMLVQNSDGSLVVRTLEQLSAACRTRLSDDAVLGGDLQTVKDELEQIIGIVGTDMDPMLARGTDNIMQDVVGGMRIPSQMGSKYRVDRALRQRSSSVERNYTLLHSIYKHYMDETGWADESIPSRQVINKLSSQKIAELKKDSWSLANTLKNGIAFPKDIYSDNGPQLNTYGDRTYLYDYIGRANDADLRLIPGPQSMVLFDQFNEGVFDQCMRYGITAAFTDLTFDSVPEYLQNKLIQISLETWKENKKGEKYQAIDNLWLLPCFDIQLNDGVGEGAIMEAPAEIPINPDNGVINVESTTGEFKPGDATYHITNELSSRIKVNFRGKKVLTADQLFPNAKEFFGNKDYNIDYCSNQEVQQYILNAELDVDNLVMRGPAGTAVVDIGVPQGDRSFEREKQRFAIRLQEYMARTDIDDESVIMGDVGFDSIIGFVKITFHGSKGGTVLAPVWPFHLEGPSIGVPTQYKSKLTLDRSADSFVVDWEFTGSIEDQYIKFFEGIGASNKLITGGERARSRTLENGLAVDGFYASASVASRLFSSNKRIHTMISAMMMTRMDPNYSYNFAELSESFPGDPTFTREDSDEPISIKEALLNATLGKADWKTISSMDITYHNDPEINSIVKWWVNKCVNFGTVNPTTLLATRTPDGILWPKITEFECFMDTSPKFQKAWMKLMHEMMPTLMPDSVDGKSDNCLFVPVTKGNTDEDYGVLQMRVPYWDSDGRPYKKLENVYISMGFFGEEFSGFKAVNFNAYRRSLDNLNVANEVDGDDLIQLLTFARSGMTNVKPAIHLEVVPDNAMANVPPSEIDASFDKRQLDRKTYGKVLALTGHRPDKIDKDAKWNASYDSPKYQRIANELIEYCRQHNIDTVVSGMATGFDQLGALAVLKESGIKLVAAVPMPGQEKVWREADQKRWREILGMADTVIYVSEKPATSRTDAAIKLDERNHWMVDNADDVFALYDRSSGGTQNAVAYAKGQKKHVHILNPDDVSSSEIEPSRFQTKEQINKKKPTPNIIDSFRGEYAFLSNMFDSDVYQDIWRFPNAEAAFQAYKLLYAQGDSNLSQEDFEKLSGKEARQLGRKIKNLNITEWDKVKYDVMKAIIEKKFSNPDLAPRLLATGDAELIEGNTWGDTYWGVSNGKGQNNLGKILMEVREMLRRGEINPEEDWMVG